MYNRMLLFYTDEASTALNQNNFDLRTSLLNVDIFVSFNLFISLFIKCCFLQNVLQCFDVKAAFPLEMWCCGF